MTPLADVFAKILKEPAESFTAESSRQNSVNWTSLKHVALLVAIETEYSVKFSNPEMTTMFTMGDIRKVLTEKGVSDI